MFSVERQDIVDALVHNGDIRSELHDALLCCVPDVARIIQRLIRKRAALSDCQLIYQLCVLLPQFIGVSERLHEQAQTQRHALAINAHLLRPLQVLLLHLYLYSLYVCI